MYSHYQAGVHFPSGEWENKREERETCTMRRRTVQESQAFPVNSTFDQDFFGETWSPSPFDSQWIADPRYNSPQWAVRDRDPAALRTWVYAPVGQPYSGSVNTGTRTDDSGNSPFSQYSRAGGSQVPRWSTGYDDSTSARRDFRAAPNGPGQAYAYRATRTFPLNAMPGHKPYPRELRSLQAPEMLTATAEGPELRPVEVRTCDATFPSSHPVPERAGQTAAPVQRPDPQREREVLTAKLRRPVDPQAESAEEQHPGPAKHPRRRVPGHVPPRTRSSLSTEEGPSRAHDRDVVSDGAKRPKREAQAAESVPAGESRVAESAGSDPVRVRGSNYKRLQYLTADFTTVTQRFYLHLVSSVQDPAPVTPAIDLLAPGEGSLWGTGDGALPRGVERKESACKELNWVIGVESSKAQGGIGPLTSIEWPEDLRWERRAMCRRLCCAVRPQVYRAVNLSQPPNGKGFKHVELIAGEVPAMSCHKDLLVIKCNKFFYLGAASTCPTVSGLLICKVYAGDTSILEDILDMHTALQVHPFVPRTFVLQISSYAARDTENAGSRGVFISEAAGTANLGCAFGMLIATEGERRALAFHVTRCLLRAQIVALRTFGFTLRYIQPARIWRYGDGFRLDFLGCLIDNLSRWQTGDSQRAGAAGLVTVYLTLCKLGVAAYLPDRVKSTLTELHLNAGKELGRRTKDREVSPDGDGPLFEDEESVIHEVYNMCAFTTRATSSSSTWESLLGPEQYQPITLNTGYFPVDPYGPFNVRVHSRHFKWNVAIVVEPVVDGNADLAQILGSSGYRCKLCTGALQAAKFFEDLQFSEHNCTD